MEIWHISQIAEVVVLSHTKVATSLTLAQSLNSNLGMERFKKVNDSLQPYLKAFAEKFYNPTGLSGKRYILHYYGRIL